MRSQSQVTGLFNFLNNGSISQDLIHSELGRKQKTNASFVSDKTQNSKNLRIPTINKDYSFVMLDKSTIKQNEKQQQDEKHQVSISSLHDHESDEDVFEFYKNWLSRTRKSMIQNQGIKILQESIKKISPPQIESEAEKKIIDQNNVSAISKQQVRNHFYFNLEIAAVSNILWDQFSEEQQTKNLQNQLYCKFVISLQDEFNPLNPKQYPKRIATEIIRLDKKKSKQKQLGSSKTVYKYSTDQKFSIFLHTDKENLSIKIQLILFDIKRYSGQQKEQSQINQQAQIVDSSQIFSFVTIPLNIKKGSQHIQIQKHGNGFTKYLKKQFQKYQKLYFPQTGNQNDLNQRRNSKSKYPKPPSKKQENSFGIIYYNLIDSQYYRLLSKFIPNDYLVWHKDQIPGLLGSYLPKLDDLLFQISPSTEVKSIQFQVQKIQIQAKWFTRAKQKAEKQLTYFNKMTSNQVGLESNGISLTPGSIHLSLIFHNGLKQVTKVSVDLVETMQIQKKIDSLQSQKLTSKYQSKGQNSNLILIKIFSSPMIFLPQAFNELNCSLILQVEKKFGYNKLDQVSKQSRTEQLLIPVAFTFFNPQTLKNNKPFETKFIEGWYFDQNALQKSRKIKTANNMVLGSLNNFFSSKNNIDQIISKGHQKAGLFNSQRSFSKISLVCSFKDPQFDATWTFQRGRMQQSLILKNKLQGANTNRSILLNSQETKIDAQKQKILKKLSNNILNIPASKNLKKQSKKLQIREQIFLQQNLQNLYVIKLSNKNENLQKKQLNDLMSFLQQKSVGVQKQTRKSASFIDEVAQKKSSPSPLIYYGQKNFKYTFSVNEGKQAFFFKSYQELFHQYSSKSFNIVTPTHQCFAPNLYRMFYPIPKKLKSVAIVNNPFSRMTQNNSLLNLEYKESLSQFGFELTPIQLIRTQLAEANYNNLILINPLSLKPLQVQNNSFFMIPDKFFMKIFFQNLQSQTSPCFKIDPSTGQIVVFIPKQSAQQPVKTAKNNQKDDPNKFRLKNSESKRQVLNLNNPRDLDKLKLKKIFHFEYGTEDNYSNSKQLFVDFIDYLYNGFMQIRLYDEFQQIGKGYFKLRNLIRRRRNEVSTILEQSIYSKEGPICEIKIECKCMRKQKPPKNTFRKSLQKKQQIEVFSNKQKDTTKTQVSNQKNEIINSKSSLEEKHFVDKQKQRIERFKKQKLEEKTKKITQKQKQIEQIQRIIQRNYLMSQYRYKVFSFKKTYMLVELQNRSEKKGFFYVNTTDDDFPYYKDDGNSEIKIIRNFHAQISEREKQKIMAVQSNREKFLKYKKLYDNYEIELQEKEKIIVVCQYFSKRKYLSQSSDNSQQAKTQLFKYFNHQHTITVSLLESSNKSTIVSIAKLHIFPEPSQNVVQIKSSIKKNERKLVTIPFLLSHIVKQKYDIYINHDRCSVIYQSRDQTQNNDRQIYNSTVVSNAHQRFYESSRSNKGQIMRQKNGQQESQSHERNKINQNLSIFGRKESDHIKQVDLINTQSKNKQERILRSKHHKLVNQKQFNFISILLPYQIKIENDSQRFETNKIQLMFLPKNQEVQHISLEINLHQIQIEQVLKIPIFEVIKTTLRIHHKSLEINGKIAKIVGIICESSEFKINNMWIQLDHRKSFTEVEFKFTSTMYGNRSFEIILIDPLKYSHFYCQAVQSSVDFSKLYESYINRMLLKIITPFPSLKSQLILNIALQQSFTKQGIQQEFSYSNGTVYTTVFRIYTSHPWFIHLDQKDRVCQIKAKSQKKLKLKINTKRIIEEYFYALRGQNQELLHQNENTTGQKRQNQTNRINESSLIPVIILGFVSDKVSQNFGISFRFF